MPDVTVWEDQAAPARAPGPGERAATRQPARPPDPRSSRRFVPVAAGWLSMLIGLADIAGQLVPGLPERYPRLAGELHKINGVVPGTGLANAAHAAGIIVGLLLLMLSHGLRRRKRRAWQAVMLLLAANVALHLLHVPHVISAVVSAALMVALWWFRGEFYAAGDPRTRWRALITLAWLAAADLAIGLAYLALARGLAGQYTVGQRIQSVAYGLAGLPGPVQFTVQDRGDLFTLLTGTLSLFTLVVTAYLFLRCPGPAARQTADDAGRIRDLLATHGDRDSLGYFALRDDKSIIWSPTGKSCVGYRVVSGVMLASGDPVGDPEAWPGAIHAFLDQAARHAWVPAVIGCSELGAEVWCREGGLTALELGDEAIVEVAGFRLHGRPMRNVRQMASRTRRHGYVAEIRRVAGIPRAEIHRLISQAGSWRGNPTERGFSMALGRIGHPEDGDCVIATASKDGELRALLHFVPWGAEGLSLDLMRRDRSAQPGLNDFLITETIRHAPDLGVKRISLNFAVFRAALERGERIGAWPALRAWRRILLLVSKWFQIDSLYKFNAKFCPAWVPRFFAYPGTGDIPRIAIAALKAEAFLIWPAVAPLRLPGRLSFRAPARPLPPRGENPPPGCRGAGHRCSWLVHQIQKTAPHSGHDERQRGRLCGRCGDLPCVRVGVAASGRRRGARLS